MWRTLSKQSDRRWLSPVEWPHSPELLLIPPPCVHCGHLNFANTQSWLLMRPKLWLSNTLGLWGSSEYPLPGIIFWRRPQCSYILVKQEAKNTLGLLLQSALPRVAKTLGPSPTLLRGFHRAKGHLTLRGFWIAWFIESSGQLGLLFVSHFAYLASSFHSAVLWYESSPAPDCFINIFRSWSIYSCPSLPGWEAFISPSDAYVWAKESDSLPAHLHHTQTVVWSQQIFVLCTFFCFTSSYLLLHSPSIFELSEFSPCSWK